MRHLIKYIFVAGCLTLLWGCQQEESWLEANKQTEGNNLQLNIQTQGLMEEFTVSTRGDIKTPEEQEIKSLHVFIFDEEGNYLDSADEHRYQGYRSFSGGQTVMNIDREGWADPTKAEKATVIVVANVEPGTFQVETADTPPTNIPNRDALVNFVYRPLTQRLVTALPESGMPMYVRKDNLNLTRGNTEQSIDIAMKALMARVDITFEIDSKHTDVEGNLPQLTVDKCKVLNVPEATTFTENTEQETNLKKIENGGMGKQEYILPNTSAQTINNRKGQLSYTFYTFENLQKPAVTDYTYPEGVTPDQQQRYKPELADKDNSMAFELSGHYITYNGASYDVVYTLYLGANHTNDFKVMRNKQYKNNVTIQGIVNVGNNEEHVTFDTRVNVSTSNPYFVSMLKDRTMDSHFNVVPMDIYFFNTNSSNPPKQTMKVEIMEPEKNNWVRMEKIPAANMMVGTAPVASSGPELLATNKKWHAGNGKRKYFTTDLVTNTLADNSEITVDASRDRIYFYVDENLDTWLLNDDPTNRTRTATVKLTYYENDVEKGTRNVMIEQAKLLQVTYHTKDEGGEDEDKFVGATFYVEMYEEYLSHGDPLDEFTNEQVYTGLPWGASGTEIGYIGGTIIGRINAYENYYWGSEFTTKIVNLTENIANLTLNTKPNTAAGYCHIKNKRNSDGSVPNPKWFMPGIRQLERILEDYYIEYPEFQNNYYWSSAAGRASVWDIPYENQQNARATKAYIGVDGKFHYYESSEDYPYTSENGTGGAAKRTQSLRIRAARIDNLPQ